MNQTAGPIYVSWVYVSWVYVSWAILGMNRGVALDRHTKNKAPLTHGRMDQTRVCACPGWEP